PYEQAADAVRREIERHRLKILGINTPLGPAGEAGLARGPGPGDEFYALFYKALRYAGGVGGTPISRLCGPGPPEQQAEGEKVFVANLGRAAACAGEHSIAILIEPINRRDRPNYLLHRPEQASAIIAQIGLPNVRMQFDFYHVQIEGGDLMTR